MRAERHVADPPGWLALGAQALAAFDAAGVGREPLADEAGSDALVRTSTKAAGVLRDPGRQPALRPEGAPPGDRPRARRVLLPYWIVNGLAGGAPLLGLLAALGLVIGGLLLALGLFGILGWAGPVSGTVGAAILLAAIGYSALRTGSLLHGVALLGPVLPLAAYALNQRPGEDAGTAAGGLMALLALAAGLYLLARIPWPLRSPRAHRSHPGVPPRRRAAAGRAVCRRAGRPLARRRGGLGDGALVGRCLPRALAVGAGSPSCHRQRPGAGVPAPAATDLPAAPPGLAPGPFVWEPVDDADGVGRLVGRLRHRVPGAAWLLWCRRAARRADPRTGTG